ncbi:MAG: hypothetical protein AAB664_03355, partial [Patescibacteria group bacterium]
GASPSFGAETTTQATAEQTQVAAAIESLAQAAVVVEPTYDGIEVEKPTKAPSRFGSFWRSVKENVSLAITFDPNKKAQIAIKFAEERMLIAEKVLSETTDEQAKAQVQKHLERAKKMMEKIDEHQKKALENPNKDTERLLQNRAKQFERQQEIFDRLEEKSDGEVVETVLKFRDEAIEHSKALEQAVKNENIPEEVREHLKSVQSRIQEHSAEIKEHIAKFQELKAAAEKGDATAVQKLDAFKAERMKEAKMRNEEHKEKSMQFEEKMMKIRENAEQGDVQARMMFEQMQDRPEFKDHFEKMKPEFFEKDFEGNEEGFKPGDERNRDPNDRRGPPPGFEQDRNREGQPGGRTEGEPPNGKEPPQGFFSKFKEFMDQSGEQDESRSFQKNAEDHRQESTNQPGGNEQNTQKFLNRKNQVDPNDVKIQGIQKNDQPEKSVQDRR